MRALIALDKFKDAISAPMACEAVARALAKADPTIVRDACPLTDGGEGFVEILTAAGCGRRERLVVQDALGKPTTATLGFVPWRQIPLPARRRLGLESLRDDDEIAVVGMAEASGLALLPPESRDPWKTCTWGTGELLLAAASAGARAILLGIGGSATHDLGLGALGALGWRFYAKGREARPWPCPNAWLQIERIEPPVGLAFPPIRIACDVQNPLVGERGAAQVYAPQKGCRSERLAALETATLRMARMLCGIAHAAPNLVHASGMGAAGGLSFGLAVALGARLVAGAELVADWMSLEARIAAADVILTGEGRFDASSLEGKGPGMVIARALAHAKPVHVFAGAATAPGRDGIALHVITPEGQPLAEALPATAANLESAVRRVFD